MKKIIYFLVLVILFLVGWIIWGNNRIVPGPMTKPISVQSDYFKAETSAALGKYVAASNGLTLYTYSNDSKDTSTCTGACLEKWHPYLAPNTQLTKLPVNFGTMKRDDGTTQFTWYGMPLYFYYLDKVEGDAKGQQLGNLWYALKQL